LANHDNEWDDFDGVDELMGDEMMMMMTIINYEL